MATTKKPKAKDTPRTVIESFFRELRNLSDHTTERLAEICGDQAPRELIEAVAAYRVLLALEEFTNTARRRNDMLLKKCGGGR